MVNVQSSGVVYRNPKPWLRAQHAWHPCISQLPDGELVASFDLAQAVEAMDYRTWVARSTDGGVTWSAPQRLFSDAVQPTTHTVRTSVVGGQMVGIGTRAYRDDPEQGTLNHENLGYTKTDVILLRSADAGRTWSDPQVIVPPLEGPSFEVCHSIVELADGRWLWPCATWKGWDGQAPNGMKAIAFVSHDQGATWPEYLDVADEFSRGVIHWEQSLKQLSDGRLVAVTWRYNQNTAKTEPSTYVISSDGRTFTKPTPTGFLAQTCKLCVVGANRLLAIYRRDDEPGLWANTVELDGDRWINGEATPLWRGASSGMAGGRGAQGSSDDLSGLKFGFPSSVLLPGGDVLCVHWRENDAVNEIAWIRIGLS